MRQTLSRQIAETLLGVWHWHRTQEFLGYVEASFGERITELAEFEDIHLHETAEGDVERGLLLNATTIQWWVIDGQGLRETSHPKGWWFSCPADPPNLRGQFYRHPILRFHRQGDRLALGEAFGPRLCCGKVARFREATERVEFQEVRLVWNWWSLRAGRMTMDLALLIDETAPCLTTE